jgi:DNA-binding PadR family transcriptional regulator
MDRKFLLAFIRLHILHHASRSSVFGLDLIRELRRHGYEISPGTLYPTLHDLEDQGYLRCRSEIVNGRRRKYYTATGAGRRLLAGQRRRLRELASELLGGGMGP